MNIQKIGKKIGEVEGLHFVQGNGEYTKVGDKVRAAGCSGQYVTVKKVTYSKDLNMYKHYAFYPLKLRVEMRLHYYLNKKLRNANFINKIETGDNLRVKIIIYQNVRLLMNGVEYTSHGEKATKFVEKLMADLSYSKDEYDLKVL